MARSAAAKASKTAKAAPRVSLRAFAKRIGVSHTAIEKGIASGRLKESIVREKGRPYIADAELAAKEWAAGASKPSGPSASGRLTETAVRVAIQREESLRIGNQERLGRLVDAARARRDAFACARTVRDSILNVPDRIAAELAAESDPARVFARLDAELRKALESIAEVLAGGE